MGVAADCQYVSAYDGAQNATTQILMNWNAASALYKVWDVASIIRTVILTKDRIPSTSALELLKSKFRMRREPSSLLTHRLIAALVFRCPTTTDPDAPWNIDCNSNVNLNDRLSLFSEWRGQRENDSIGLWHLMYVQ